MAKGRAGSEAGRPSDVSAPAGGGGAAKTTRAAVERARVALRHLIELSGLSRREVEKRLLDLGCGTDLGRLLVSGRLDLKLRHILDILRVIEVYPLEFFSMICERPRERSPLLGRLEAIVFPTRVGARTEGVAPCSEVEALERLLARLAELTGEVEGVLAARAGAAAPGGEGGHVTMTHPTREPEITDRRQGRAGPQPAAGKARCGGGALELARGESL
jgi:hypothetical protein